MVTRAAARGYTIIEIAVVIFIIGIFGVMVAIGAVAVLDTQTENLSSAHAQDVVLAQQNFAQRYGTYTGFPSDLPEADGYVVVTEESADATQVSVAVGVAGTLGVAVRTDDETCVHYRVPSLATGGSAVPVDLGPSSVCAGEEALPSGEARSEGSADTSAAW
jgi:type II secretory pathway pseudopilin PulG